MRQGFCTQHRIKEELVEEEVNPHLVVGPIIQRLRQAARIFQWEPRWGPPPAPGTGGAGVLRGTGSSAGAPPPGMNVDASSYGSGPPPQAPGCVGIKRRAGKASSSTDPLEVDDSYYYDGPSPAPPGVGAIAAQVMTGVLQQTAQAQEAARYAVTEAHIARILHAQRTEAQKRVIREEIRPVHHNMLQSMIKKVRVVQPAAPAPPTAIDQIAIGT